MPALQHAGMTSRTRAAVRSPLSTLTAPLVGEPRRHFPLHLADDTGRAFNELMNQRLRGLAEPEALGGTVEVTPLEGACPVYSEPAGRDGRPDLGTGRSLQGSTGPDARRRLGSVAGGRVDGHAAPLSPRDHPAACAARSSRLAPAAAGLRFRLHPSPEALTRLPRLCAADAWTPAGRGRSRAPSVSEQTVAPRCGELLLQLRACRPAMRSWGVAGYLAEGRKRPALRPSPQPPWPSSPRCTRQPPSGRRRSSRWS